jgi:hypothetical protein
MCTSCQFKSLGLQPRAASFAPAAAATYSSRSGKARWSDPSSSNPPNHYVQGPGIPVPPSRCRRRCRWLPMPPKQGHLIRRPACLGLRSLVGLPIHALMRAAASGNVRCMGWVQQVPSALPVLRASCRLQRASCGIEASDRLRFYSATQLWCHFFLTAGTPEGENDAASRGRESQPSLWPTPNRQGVGGNTASAYPDA